MIKRIHLTLYQIYFYEKFKTQKIHIPHSNNLSACNWNTPIGQKEQTKGRKKATSTC